MNDFNEFWVNSIHPNTRRFHIETPPSKEYETFCTYFPFADRILTKALGYQPDYEGHVNWSQLKYIAEKHGLLDVLKKALSMYVEWDFNRLNKQLGDGEDTRKYIYNKIFKEVGI